MAADFRFREYFKSILFCVPRYVSRVTSHSLKYKYTSATTPPPPPANDPTIYQAAGPGTNLVLPVRALGPLKSGLEEITLIHNGGCFNAPLPASNGGCYPAGVHSHLTLGLDQSEVIPPKEILF